MLKELYNIIKEISIIPPKPFNKFYEEHKQDKEQDLLQMLRVGRQVMKLKVD